MYMLSREQYDEYRTQPCWLCGKVTGGKVTGGKIIIWTERITPGGERCLAKQVPVHHPCYMDMDP